MTVLTHPVDVDAVGLIFFRNNQSLFDILLAHALVKRQQDIRRFRRIGDFYLNHLRVFTAAVREHNGLQSRQHQSLLAVLKRHRLHHRRHAMVRPAPLRKTLDPAVLNIPTAAALKAGMHNLRHQYPNADINNLGVHLCHRAEVDINVLERILHALADAGAADGHGSLSAHDKVDIRAEQLESADNRHILRDLHSAFDDAVGANAEIQGVLAPIHAAESPQLDGGFQNDHIDRLTWQIQLQFLGAGKVDALVGRTLIFPLLPVELEGVAEPINDLPTLAYTDDPDVRCREGDLTRADHHIPRALDEVEIGARQRAAQLDGRNGKVIAVHRFCQIHEARAAAVELTNGNGRNKGDAGACLDIEIQRVRQQAAVLFAARQLQLRLGLKEVKDVQLQFKGVELIILEGVDLALDLGKLQRHHLRGGKAARGVDAVDLELIPL